MKLEHIIKEFGKLPLREIRRSEADYEEIVIYAEDADKWHEKLTNSLGQYLDIDGCGCTTSCEATEKAVECVNRFGGVRSGQFVYYRDFDDLGVMVLLWPWTDDHHITLKKVLL